MAQDDDNLENPEVTGNRISKGFRGAGTNTPDDLRQRAEELAIIEGLRPEDANAGHLRRAREELLGGGETPNDVMPESTTLADRDPVSGSGGRHTPNLGANDEPMIGEELYAQGVEEAVHDEMLEASETLERRERGLEADDDGR